MAQPTPWVSTTSYQTYANNNPSAPFPPSALDSDFANLETTIADILANLLLIQRDDGALANGSVTLDTLDQAVYALMGDWVPRGTWAASTNYAVGDLVTPTGTTVSYVCATAHTSGATFAAGLALGYWQPINGVGNVAISAASLSISQTDVVIGRATAGAGAGEEISCTSFGRAVIGAASAAAQRTALGLGVADNVQFGNIVAANIQSSTFALHAALYTDASFNMASTAAMTNGQLLVGSTGANPALATLTGTANQVVVTNAAGSITLSAPQNIAAGSSPTFAGLSLTGLAQGGVVFVGASSVLKQDMSYLIWDDTNNRLGIGNNAPVRPLDVTGIVRAYAFEDAYNILYYNAVPDGVVDNTAAIQAAIDAVNATTPSGGFVYFPSGTYKFNSQITMKPFVTLAGEEGAVLKWGGGATVAITSGTGTILERAGMIGLKYDCATASKALELYSAYQCVFRDIRVSSNSSTNFIVDVRVNTAGATNPDGNRNAAYSRFQNVLQDGTCGTFMRMIGDSTAPTVVTLNTVDSCTALSCAVRGLDLAKWADSNRFSGINRFYITANNAIGVEINSDSPAADRGVYANTFSHLAVDSFGALAGRVGLKMGLSKQTKIEFYYNDPPAESGQYTTTANVEYDMTYAIAGTNRTERVKGSISGEDVMDRYYRLNDGVGTNFERMNIGWIGNDFLLYTSSGGTGVTRALKFGVANAAYWGITTAGDWIADTDNLSDIGNTTPKRPRDIRLSRDIYTASANFMHRTTAALPNGAGAGGGTLLNAPAAGNPTKWIPIDDNGTTRYLPAW